MQQLELTPLQKTIKDLVLTIPDPEILKNLPYHVYLSQFRTFAFRLPRLTGKTSLIADIATHLIEHGRNPLIIVHFESYKDMYPKYLHKYIKAMGPSLVGLTADAVFLDEIDWGGDSYTAENKETYFKLRLYTPTPGN